MLIFAKMKLIDYILDNDSDEVDFIIKFSKEFSTEKDHFGVGDLLDKSFIQVKDSQALWIDKFHVRNNIDIVSILTGKPTTEIMHWDLMAFFDQVNFIGSQLTKINEIESTLYDTVSVADKDAGIDNFAQFGVYTQFRELCNGDLTKLEDVKKLKYGVAFTELKFRHELVKFEKRKNEMLINKKI